MFTRDLEGSLDPRSTLTLGLWDFGAFGVTKPLSSLSGQSWVDYIIDLMVRIVIGHLQIYDPDLLRDFGGFTSCAMNMLNSSDPQSLKGSQV
jgi:hypothetical protein